MLGGLMMRSLLRKSALNFTLGCAGQFNLRGCSWRMRETPQIREARHNLNEALR